MTEVPSLKGFTNAWFRKKSQPMRSPGEIVLATKRARRAALVSLGLNVGLAAVIYFIFIWPIFLKHDLANPEVVEFIQSEFFQKNTQEKFEALRYYNQSTDADALEVPNEFYAVSGGQNALVVKMHYRLTERAPLGNELRTTGSVATKPHYAYAYTPEIEINLAIIPLAGTLTFLMVLIGCMVYLAPTPPELKTEYADKALASYLLGNADELTDHMQEGSGLKKLESLLDSFHAFARQLQKRHANRSTISFNDEYDVQDALHAILKLHYADVRSEEYVPSYAGKCARTDFLLKVEAMIIEVKMTRKNLRDKEIGDELIVDIERYQEHPNCGHLICFVYDPQGLLANPRGLKNDLESKERSMGVTVVISPTH